MTDATDDDLNELSSDMPVMDGETSKDAVDSDGMTDGGDTADDDMMSPCDGLGCVAGSGCGTCSDGDGCFGAQDCAEGLCIDQICNRQFCKADQRVDNNLCVDCVDGTRNAPGDHAGGPDTTCSVGGDFCSTALGDVCENLVQRYLKARDASASDYFGHSIAVSGNTIAVGAPGDSLLAAGSGAVYIFERTGNTFLEVQKIKAKHPAMGDQFGHAVALQGNTLIVGAPREDNEAVDAILTEENTISEGSTTNNSGAVYIFERSDTNVIDPWEQTFFVKASATATTPSGAGILFGHSVDISGSTFVVGAPNTNDGGAAYVFVTEDQGASWREQGDSPLTGAEANGQDSAFGYAVAIDGDRIAVGDERDDAIDANGTLPPQGSSDDEIDFGAAYIFERTGDVWVQRAYLKASTIDKSDRLGYAIDLDGDMVAVGIRNFGRQPGAVEVFVRDSNGNWNPDRLVQPLVQDNNDRFGSAIALANDTLVALSPAEYGSGTNFSGDPSDNTLMRSGAIYVFTRSSTTWIQQAYIKTSNPDADDMCPGMNGNGLNDNIPFNKAIAYDGNTLAIGMPCEDGSASSTAGMYNNDTADAGAVYVPVVGP